MKPTLSLLRIVGCHELIALIANGENVRNSDSHA